MKSVWKGQYLNGKASKTWKVEIRPLKEGLSVKTGRGRARVWPYSEIRQTQGRYAGEIVRLERGEEVTEALTVSDTNFLTALRAKSREGAGRFHNPGFRRTRLWLTVFAGVSTLVVSFGAYRWGIPALADNVAARVPIEWEEKLGASMLGQLAPVESRIQNPHLNQAISKIVWKLTGTLTRCPYHFRVTVSDLPIVNAFALPGGNIVVFRGLIDETDSADELAGVLAHEIQHVLKRHTTRRIFKESSTGLLLSAISGDFTGSVAFGVKSAGTLAMIKYNRDEEAEADREGMKMILAAGIDPQGMINFFEKLKNKEKLPQFFKFVSDHPATGDRIEALKGMVSRQARLDEEKLKDGEGVQVPVPEKPAGVLPETEWPALVKELDSAI
jgi:Zn-dependent protease with chaperone function